MRIVSEFYIPIFILSDKSAVKERHGRAGSLFLNDSASPKMGIKIYFNIFRFFIKVVELFECRRSDSYTTANRKFVRFAHS